MASGPELYAEVVIRRVESDSPARLLVFILCPRSWLCRLFVAVCGLFCSCRRQARSIAVSRLSAVVLSLQSVASWTRVVVGRLGACGSRV